MARQISSPEGNPVYIGIDVGSISVKLAAIGDHLPVLKDSAIDNFFTIQFKEYPLYLSKYKRAKGETFQSAVEILTDLIRLIPIDDIANVHVTGSGGKQLSDFLKTHYENEFRAVSVGIGTLYPEVRTIFEMGGDNAKYLSIETDSTTGTIGIVDYDKNGDCAAGTGSFMDQQANRLKYDIEEIGEIVSHAGEPATIAGRCSVFAKSDMIHAQQKGYQPPEILKGLSEAVVRNFKSNIVKGRTIVPKIAFIGGVAANQGVVQAMKEVFGIQNEEFFVPDCYAWGGAIGAALLAKVSGRNQSITHLIEDLSFNPPGPMLKTDSGLPLKKDKVHFLRDRIVPYTFQGKILPVDTYLGIDVGSVSTNLVLIDDEYRIVKEIYVYTQARPIEVVNNGLKEIKDELSGKIEIKGVGTTGSGRELIGELIGADVIRDEITAHKTGAMYISEKLIQAKVDTIFEIGGQDSKFISIQNGVVVDFAMNEACAAGTGSFLEEQAEKLGIRIKEEFSRMAFASRNPIKLGERCTVFIEKDINAYLQQGAKKEDIVAGLAYSIVLNYLNRVVRGRKIGNTIYFQGGTAYNDSVAAAFSIILNKEIIVPPHNGVIGAIGAAILAREKIKKDVQLTSFRGYSLEEINYSVKHFTCKACSNFCDMQEIKVDSEKTYWGDKCSDKFRKKAKIEKKPVLPNLFESRERLLMEGYHPDQNSGKRRIGIPRSMHFYDQFPFWNAYFTELGYQVVISEPTNKDIINSGGGACVAEPCFPIKVAHGHVNNLLDKKCDFIFQPNVIDAETKFTDVNSHLCPWNQTLPFVIQNSSLSSKLAESLWMPTVHFRKGAEAVTDELYAYFVKYGVRKKINDRAVQAAYRAQNHFFDQLHELGNQALRTLNETNEMALILVGRVYNVNDSGINLNIPNKLRDYYGMNLIPMDLLDLSHIDISEVNSNMYWNSGRKILQICRFIQGKPNLHLIYITNFKCGPDSYIKHDVVQASGKPYLTLQLDGHSNDGGVITRCEAYLDSKGFLR